MDFWRAKHYDEGKDPRKKKVIRMASPIDTHVHTEPIERYRIRHSEIEAWKRTSGLLTGKIPYGDDGETLSEYIHRKRAEERERG